jgi:serine protease Do
MSRLVTMRKTFVIAGCILLACVTVIGALSIRVLVRRYNTLSSEVREMKTEYVPMRDVVTGKQPHVVEKITTQSNMWRSVQERIKDAVVQIIAHVIDFDFLQPYRTPAQGTAYGSGFFINDQGVIVTNAHVVIDATAIWIQMPSSLGKRVIEAHVVGIAPERDLALLQVNEDDLQFIRQQLGDVPYLPLGDSDMVRRSDDVLAAGFPLGQTLLKTTSGMISGREQHLLQIDAAINPGSSGGPLVNIQGEAVGINSAGIREAQNVGYAITINEFKNVLPELYKFKLLRRPTLGFVVNNGTAAHAEFLGNPPPGGCHVVEVINDSPMERAGVLPGDMIYEINGYSVDQYGEMIVPWSDDRLSIVDYVSRLLVGQDILLTVYRRGECKKLSVRFDYKENSAIPRVYPLHEEVDYEVFAGMVVMQLTKNHIERLAERVPGLVRYTEMRLQATPTLVVTHIFPNSQLFRARNIAAGSTLHEVNGKPVRTLEEYREAIKSGLSERFLTFKTSDHVGRFSDNILTVLPWDKLINEEAGLSQRYHYPMTKNAAEVMSIYNAQRSLGSNEQVG